MRYSIITPSIQRESLVQCVESVNAQTCTDWEHHIWLDVIDIDVKLINSLAHPQRAFYTCEFPHRNYGHTCRRNAREHVSGDYCHFLDDDNALAHPGVLEQMKAVTADWALFPIIREGQRFFSDPPSYGHVDTGSVLVKREFAQWTESTRYEADWDFISKLMAEHPNYQAFPDVEPIMVMSRISRGAK